MRQTCTSPPQATFWLRWQLFDLSIEHWLGAFCLNVPWKAAMTQKRWSSWDCLQPVGSLFFHHWCWCKEQDSWVMIWPTIVPLGTTNALSECNRDCAKLQWKKKLMTPMVSETTTESSIMPTMERQMGTIQGPKWGFFQRNNNGNDNQQNRGSGNDRPTTSRTTMTLLVMPATNLATWPEILDSSREQTTAAKW